ncbi:MAG: polysaccharide deacetylase family protein [Rhodothermales bacterium]
MAITFDDVPGTGLCNVENALDLNQRLLQQIEAYAIPAAGFVNEGQPCGGSVLEEVLTLWLDAGHMLGNHTYAHTDINGVSLEAFIADLERGEPVTRRLLAERGDSLRYFRHPRLHAGADSAKWHELKAYLDANDYTVAPVTIDNQEWVFEAVYRQAKQRGDTATMEQLTEAYVEHLREVVTHFEGWSEKVAGYEPPQVLLLHANQINADHFGQVAAMLQERGYAFVSLDEALADPAYALKDGYIGPRGLSWIHRWALGKGMTEIEEEPREPAWVADLFASY